MRIITLNTWKNEGDYVRWLRLMCDGLAALKPDLVCLQECFIGAGRDTAETLAVHLGLDLHAAPARRKLRRYEGRLVESASGLAILTRGRGRSAAIDLPADPDDGERIAQRLDLTAEGSPLRILNLHLTHLGGSKGGTLRAAQADVALDWASEGLSGGLVVSGDLNAGAQDKALARLGLPPRPTTLQPVKRGQPVHVGPAIDHCHLWRAGAWRVENISHAMDGADENGWRPSDHKAVVLDLRRA